MSEYPDRWNDEWNDLPEDMRRFATRFGPTNAPILLLGPPGSGKGYLARILHELSPRAGGPFVPRNCGIFTESLAEAQLFGHRRGRSSAWLAGAILLICMGLVPKDVDAQVTTCYGCDKSDFQPTDPSSEMCVGTFFGRTYCASAGTKEFHLCLPYGPACSPGMSGAADELAVASARAGLTPSTDSGYLVVTDARDVVVMRRCGAEVARFAMSELGAESPAGPVAMDPRDGLDHLEGLAVATSDPRQRISEQ